MLLIPKSLPRQFNAKQRLYLTADEHYNHKNIIQYANRRFGSVGEMNEALIGCHNVIVNPTDHVIHIGDFCFGKREQFIEVLSQLNGHHYFMDGNHDQALEDVVKSADLDMALPANFTILPKLFEFTYSKYKITLCHYAMTKWWCSHYGSLHGFGHSHNTYKHPGRAIDVGVDAQNCLPISIEYFIEQTMKKEIV